MSRCGVMLLHRAGGKFNNAYLNGCLDCVDYDSRAGATECTLCFAGDYWDGSECAECSEGMVCGKGTTISTIGLKAGYWRSHDESLEILSCMSGRGACGGGSNTTNGSDPYCTNNNHGPYCDVCDVVSLFAMIGTDTVRMDHLSCP